MAGAVEPLVTGFDNGSFSGKVASIEGSGSFYSEAAMVGAENLGSFSRITDTNSHDLDVFYCNEETKRFDPKPVRWIVGEAAEGLPGMMRTTRDIDRTDSALYYVFICAALLTAFGKRGRNAKELKESRGVVDRRWMVPVKMVVNIAPAYFAYKSVLEESTIGEYVFVDRKTNTLYCFRVEECEVVPESFGIMKYKMHTLAGQILQDSKDRAILERITLAVLDFGGRTTDFTVWRKKQLVKYGSIDLGFHDVVDRMIDEVMAAPELASQFAKQPTRFDIMWAMNMRMKRKGCVKIPARHGRDVDITDIVDKHMRLFALQADEIYKNKLDSGQGINAILFGGGVSPIVRPYITGIQHQNAAFVSKDSSKIYMTNAIGTLYYAIDRFGE